MEGLGVNKEESLDFAGYLLFGIVSSCEGKVIYKYEIGKQQIWLLSYIKDHTRI